MTSSRRLNVSRDEIRTFLGILIYMGICQLPSFDDYWAGATRVSHVADAMSRNRFTSIFAKIHFHNNEDQVDDRLAKVRPLQ